MLRPKNRDDELGTFFQPLFSDFRTQRKMPPDVSWSRPLLCQTLSTSAPHPDPFPHSAVSRGLRRFLPD